MGEDVRRDTSHLPELAKLFMEREVYRKAVEVIADGDHCGTNAMHIAREAIKEVKEIKS